jgi:hypothetical protein
MHIFILTSCVHLFIFAKNEKNNNSSPRQDEDEKAKLIWALNYKFVFKDLQDWERLGEKTFSYMLSKFLQVKEVWAN